MYMSSYLGQNFLKDNDILKQIVDTIKDLLESSKSTTIIEIWPGKGALTSRIIKLPEQLICIEKDATMQHYLQQLQDQHTKMKVIFEDVLEVETGTLKIENKEKTLVVGNLPYYITSPILRKFFGSTDAIRAGGVFLIQKEVADKIVYNASKKSFLRRLINYAYNVEYCFSVPPTAFNPPPKVTSAVIRLTPKSTNTIPSLSYETMMIFLDQYSPYKRKTLWASSKIVSKLSKKSTEKWTDFDTTHFASKRLEELGWEEMKEIIG